jgi:hypothetical protein
VEIEWRRSDLLVIYIDHSRLRSLRDWEDYLGVPWIMRVLQEGNELRGEGSNLY